MAQWNEGFRLDEGRFDEGRSEAVHQGISLSPTSHQTEFLWQSQGRPCLEQQMRDLHARYERICSED